MRKLLVLACVISIVSAADPASAEDAESEPDGAWLLDESVCLCTWTVQGAYAEGELVPPPVDVQDDRVGVITGSDPEVATVTYSGLLVQSLPPIEIDPTCVEEVVDAMTSGQMPAHEALEVLIETCILHPA
jgi:hypothetical protein